jgi:hypothetical protein
VFGEIDTCLIFGNLFFKSRINPLVGAGEIAELSVSTAESKVSYII